MASTRAGSASPRTPAGTSKGQRRSRMWSLASWPTPRRPSAPEPAASRPAALAPSTEILLDTIKTQGVAIPRLGFGTFRMPGGGAQPAVETALALGFRHIDTAAMYENEAAVGAALA